MLSKLTSASAPTATLAAIFSIFANRIIRLSPFRFFPAEDVSATAQSSTLSLLMAADPTIQTIWTRHCRCRADRSSPRSSREPQSTICSSVHSEADSTSAETRCNRRSKLKPCHLQWFRAAFICRNYEFLDDSWQNSVYTSVFTSLCNCLQTTFGFGCGSVRQSLPCRQMKGFCLKLGSIGACDGTVMLDHAPLNTSARSR